MFFLLVINYTLEIEWNEVILASQTEPVWSDKLNNHDHLTPQLS